MNKLLLFDIHGTLINSEDFLKDYESQLTNFASEYFNKKILISFNGYHGLTERNNLKDIFEKQDLIIYEEKLDDFFNLSGNKYEVKRGSINLIRHVLKSLENLKEKYFLGLVTGSQKLIALKCLESAGIKNYFSFGAFGNESYDRYKLVEISVKRAIEKGWRGNEIFVIGDTPKDIESGKKAKLSRKYKIKTIGVLTGSGTLEELKLSNPNYIINNLSEIEKILN